MASTIERTVHFCRIICKKNKKRIDPQRLFAHIDNLGFDESGRYLKSLGGDYMFMRIVSANYPIRAVLGRTRMTGLPLLEKRGRTKPLSLPADSGLHEPMHFVVFSNNVLGYEYNFYAPRISSLEAYLPAKASTLVDEVLLPYLIRSDVEELLSRVGDIRLFRIRVHRSQVDVIRQMDKSLHETLDEMKSVSPDTRYLEVTLRVEKHARTGMRLPFLARIPDLLRRGGAVEGIDELRIRAKDKTTGRTEDFDFLEPLIMAKKNVVRQYDSHRSIDPDSMYEAIQQAYESLESEIDKSLESAAHSDLDGL